jgi:hypothetical protein
VERRTNSSDVDEHSSNVLAAIHPAIRLPRSSHLQPSPPAAIDLALLDRQESIAKIPDRESVGGHSRRPAGKQVVLLIQPFCESGIRVSPRSKIDELAADFLAPATGRMGC